MTNEFISPLFPTIDLRELLIPWEKCFGVNPGFISPNVIATMEDEDYDFAPVFEQSMSGRAVLGLIPRERLGELNLGGLALRSDDSAICRPEIYDRTSTSVVLDTLRVNVAVIVVVDQAEYGQEGIGLLTRSDLNKHPFRAIIYSVLAALETRLAKLVRDRFEDHWAWVSRLNEEKQARILGYWELSKRRGIDAGPVSAATLAELLTIVATTTELRSLLGYKSRNSFEDEVGRIPDLRNQIMHPVRPLITDADSITKLKTDLSTVITLTDQLKKAV